jgi:23S rRNA pseudouridine2605 synthase
MARATTPSKPQKSNTAKPSPRSADEGRGVSDAGGPLRIAKAMARAGLCSRREAERWIEDGRVSVNGRVLKTPAFEVSASDRVLIDGKPLPERDMTRLWRYHKPRGLVTTHADPQGRETVFQKLPPELPRVVSIGRLDFNTEGLLLLTNDAWVRRYRVRAKGRVTAAELQAMKDGVTIDGVSYGPIEAATDTIQGANMWLTIAIREGKNREVRKILAHLGLEVNRLIRVGFGPFQLLDLAPGGVEQVKRRTLIETLGPRASQTLGLSESPEQRKSRQNPGSEKAKAAKT